MVTEKQTAALNQFIARMVAERGLAENGYVTEEQTDGKLHVQVDMPDFPIVSIGKQGGFDMPDIRSFPQEKGGSSALDACVKGDEHLKRQKEGRKAKPVAAGAPATETQTITNAEVGDVSEVLAPEAPVQEDPNVAETTVTLE